MERPAGLAALPKIAGMELYYHYLNAGFRLPAVAGTDKMSEAIPVGSNRYYAKAGGESGFDAWIAGIQAAKRTGDWIPLAHPLGLESVELEFRPDPDGPAIEIEARARVTAKTGVEMEALVAVSAAALTIYDMCKSIDRGMQIGAIRLLSKTGGKSGDWRRDEERPA